MATDVQLEGPAGKQYEKAPKTVQTQLRKLARGLTGDPQFGEYVPLADIHNRATVKTWTARIGRPQNLYKLDLPEGWRALYTVGSRGPDRVVMILEVVDHKQYERLMGYC